jgi:hypothetical protein
VVGLHVVSTLNHRAQIEIELNNLSTETVTAYSYEIVGRYADGTQSRVAHVVDDVSALVADRLKLATRPFSTLRRGEYMRFTAEVPLDSLGAQPISIEAHITMVALGDRTVIGDAAGIDSLQESRRNQAGTIAQIVADLRSVAAAPAPKKAADDLIARLTAGERQPAQNRTRVALLRVVSRNLDQTPGAAGSALATYEAELAVLTEHSALTRREAK